MSTHARVSKAPGQVQHVLLLLLLGGQHRIQRRVEHHVAGGARQFAAARPYRGGRSVYQVRGLVGWREAGVVCMYI